ncbi:MAG TPA: serine/threonine protein kinase [Caldithrix abyssi]|uniref:Serine/threonine protein kinase n=1 Tax=Caldithrix abyssi TaxID=187145 RepID=A0A7V5RPN4_CALAY|nr:serine/threonine protein kinase [Caldithrix abyssi]
MNIKNHEILHEISRGAITTVYKARHLSLNRIVILKVLNPQWLREQDLLKRFKREARISAHLNHPNIVNVYDFAIEPDMVYISLEFVDGVSLEEYIRRHHPLSPEQIVSILTDMARALNYAHGKGVIHRDIKPANILIDDNFTARLTDFGLASFQDAPGVTSQGQSMGTPAYMPPELIRGEPAGPQSDLYSLGLTLYEMLSGHPPFRKENTAATLQAVLTETPPDIATLRPEAPGWLHELTRRLMEREPRNRPERIGQLLDILERETDTSLPAARRKKRTGRLTITALLLLAAGVLYFFPETTPPSPGSPPSITDTTRNRPDTLLARSPEKKTALPATESIPAKRGTETKKSPATRPAPPVARTGALYVSCTPWATVMLDGDSLDVTPMKRPLPLSAGSHILELINPNYKSRRFTLDIQAGRTDTLNVRLEPNFAYLMIKATPWARIYINGKYREDTPLEKSIIIPAGRNILKLVNPTLGSISDTIHARAGEQLEKHFSFKN